MMEITVYRTETLPDELNERQRLSILRARRDIDNKEARRCPYTTGLLLNWPRQYPTSKPLLLFQQHHLFGFNVVARLQTIQIDTAGVISSIPLV